MSPSASLAAASIAFVGTHFAMSHPLRAAMVRTLGERGFLGVYSLVSAACMAWMYLAFGEASVATPLWPGFDDVGWAIGSVVSLVAMVLLVGSLFGNPALPQTSQQTVAAASPHGVFRTTRHPMMWGFALWAASHIVAAPTARTLVVAGAVLILALAGAHLQDRKKRALLGAAWAGWEARTGYWPRWSALPRAGAVPWLGGIAAWLLASWLHGVAGSWAAGVFRWL